MRVARELDADVTVVRRAPQSLHGRTDIERALAERQVDASIQNLYRTVAQLVAAQVLLRETGKLSLNLVCATRDRRFADTVRRRDLA